MDFWEVAKILVRRWVITLPLLLLTAAVAFLIPPRIDPTYSATASTVVITPADFQNPANPFLALGPTVIASGLAASGDSGAALQEAATAGFADSFVVNQQNSRSPIVLIQVEAATPELAVATTEYVRQALANQLGAQQSAVGAPQQSQYYLEDLSGEVSAVPVFDGAQRVLFLSIGLGVLVTVGVALLVEGMAVLRERRRETSHDLSADARERLAMLDEREAMLVERERVLRARERELARRGWTTREPNGVERGPSGAHESMTDGALLEGEPASPASDVDEDAVHAVTGTR